MDIKNFCLVVMGETDGVTTDLEMIADTKPSILDANGFIIATFPSAATIHEISQFFKETNRNFLLFELDPNTSGFNFEKKSIQKGLFGFLATEEQQKLQKKVEQIMKEISAATNTNTTKIREMNPTELGKDYTDLTTLEHELKAALKKEDYELAAKLRDTINQLNGNKKSTQ